MRVNRIRASGSERYDTWMPFTVLGGWLDATWNRGLVHTCYPAVVMAGQLAIVAYRSLVGGVLSDSMDFQVRWFADEDAEEVRRLIQAEPLLDYLNSDGQLVTWELARIFAIEPFSPHQSGEEIVGFIASTQELSELA